VDKLDDPPPIWKAWTIVIGVVLLITIMTVGNYWLACQWFPPPKSAGEFGDTFGLVGAVFAGLPLVFVLVAMYLQRKEFTSEINELQQQTKLLKKQHVHELLSTALLEYRSVEMFAAVKHLWNFFREHGGEWRCLIEGLEKNSKNTLIPPLSDDRAKIADAMVSQYKKIKEADETRIGKLDESERLKAEAVTLHYRRQLVSRYYQFLTGVYEEGIVESEVVYRYWSRGQLRIIPTLLEPIERSLDGLYNLGQDNKSKTIRILYDKSPFPGT